MNEISETIGLFILLAGFIIGLGAVTVIDIHGFLGRKSKYWTEATTRTHKVTKPLIWIGIFLITIGGIIYYSKIGIQDNTHIQILSLTILILNGLFLTFKVSPYLIKKEESGNSSKLLPKNLQYQITISFIISFIIWWTSLFLVTQHILQN